MTVIGGPSSQLLAGRVASILNEELLLSDYKVFPDNEAYTQVVSEIGDEVTIIQSTPTDHDIVYLLQLLDVCRGKKINLVIPYYGYARQDKIFKPGEPMTARAIAHALSAFLEETDRVFCVNIHAPTVLHHFKCRTENLNATPLLSEKLLAMNLVRPVVISPDKGAVLMAQVAAQGLGADWDHLEKTRLSGTEVAMAPKEIDIIGRDAVLVDDMIATGGTMATAISMLKKQGANRVFLASVHPVLAGNAMIKLYRSGVESVIATDTLEKGVSTVSVAPLVARALRD